MASSINERPWADLLPEICNVVMDQIDIFSILRFPAVCTSWAAAVAANPPRLSGGPTLLTSLADDDDDEYYYNNRRDGDGDNDECTFTLHDVSTDKSFHATTTGLKDRWWVGAKDDWLVTVDDEYNTELLRPLTGARVRLPMFDTIPSAEVKNNGRYDFKRIILCETPTANGESYLAIAMVFNLLAFTGAGDQCWTALKNPTAMYLVYEDAIVHKGKIFAVTESGDVYCWDMNGALEPELVESPENNREFSHEPVQHPDLNRRFKRQWNLAKSGGGHLLLVSTYGVDVRERRYSYKHVSYNYRFEIHGVWLNELDVDNGNWRHISSLGDCALFLGASYPFSVVVPRGSKDLEANCIYFTKSRFLGFYCMHDSSSDDLLVFDLDDKRCVPITYPCQNYEFQTPIWFRPTGW